MVLRDYALLFPLRELLADLGRVSVFRRLLQEKLEFARGGGEFAGQEERRGEGNASRGAARDPWADCEGRSEDAEAARRASMSTCSRTDSERRRRSSADSRVV